MESSLHRQLKHHYADADSELEVTVDGYRIDVVRGDVLIEIQHASLASIRDKLQVLLEDHPVKLVKPIVARKRIIKLTRKGGKVVSQRWSPKRGTILNLFDELIYFTNVFPHRRLTLVVPLVEVEERRYPGHGRKRWRRENDFQIEDQHLVSVQSEHTFRTCSDLLKLLPAKLPRPFHTGHLAEGLGVQRWIAQRAAYCLREMGALTIVGKQGNAHLYQRAKASRRTKKGRAA